MHKWYCQERRNDTFSKLYIIYEIPLCLDAECAKMYHHGPFHNAKRIALFIDLSFTFSTFTNNLFMYFYHRLRRKWYFVTFFWIGLIIFSILTHDWIYKSFLYYLRHFINFIHILRITISYYKFFFDFTIGLTDISDKAQRLFN